MSETLAPDVLRQIVQQEMQAFVQDTARGRSNYSSDVRGQEAAMIMAAEEINRSTQVDLNTLQRRVDWMIDVYDQAIGFGRMSYRYPKEVSGDDAIFKETRQKIIDVLQDATNRSLTPAEFKAFKHLFLIICPPDVRPGFFQRLQWGLKYRSGNTFGDFPEEISEKEFRSYARGAIPKLENQL